MPSIPGFGRPGGFGPSFSGGFGMRSSSEDQVAGNLVEIGIYGIASLYEKFQLPETKKDDAAGGTPPTTPTLPTTPMTPPPAPPAPMPPAPMGDAPVPPK